MYFYHLWKIGYRFYERGWLPLLDRFWQPYVLRYGGIHPILFIHLSIIRRVKNMPYNSDLLLWTGSLMRTRRSSQPRHPITPKRARGVTIKTDSLITCTFVEQRYADLIKDIKAAFTESRGRVRNWIDFIKLILKVKNSSKLTQQEKQIVF